MACRKGRAVRSPRASGYWSRFADDGALLILMTPWHVDALLGRFIKRFPDAKLLRYAEIAERNEQHRRAGEALFPELKPLDFLQERRKVMTEASWQSIYQQHPIIVGGGIFPIDKLRVLPVFDRSKIRTSVRAWDKAAVMTMKAAMTMLAGRITPLLVGQAN